MATEVILPMLGETMNEGTIVSWQKQEGDAVRLGDVLFTVESDKATLEVEAQASGVLRKIVVSAGQTVPVLSLVAWIAASMDESVSAAAGAPRGATAAASLVKPASPEASRQEQPSGRIVASPRARRAARERGIDLNRLQRSNRGDRIIERDVLNAPVTTPPSRSTPVAERAAQEIGVDLTSVLGTGPGGRITREDVERAAAAPKRAPEAVEPFSRAHRLMADRMTASFTTAPHFYLHVEASAQRLLTLRQELLPALEASAGVHLTLTDILVKLCGLALVKHPRALAQWTPDGLRHAAGVNIGVATDTPAGLVVPVIRDADRIGLAEVARRRTELVERARAGKSQLQDFEQGVFTLTNLGMFRVDSFDAILNPPQAVILAVGRIKERAVALEGQLVIEPTLQLSLSVDHRVLDGAAAARLLDDLVVVIETPSLALA